MKRYALIVGIGEYTHLKDLSKPATDAQAVYDLLKEKGDFQDIQLLNEQVTTARLEAALKTLLLQRAKNNDLLLYFTGHGFTEGDEVEQKGLFATHDCRITQQNGSIVASQNGISFSWLNIAFLSCIERNNNSV